MKEGANRGGLAAEWGCLIHLHVGTMFTRQDAQSVWKPKGQWGRLPRRPSRMIRRCWKT